MLGYNIDVTKMDRFQAYDYIKNRCDDCENFFYCNGKESQECNKKVEYLVEKFKLKFRKGD